VRERIVKEIQRLADANGGQPPGARFFEQQTGIRSGAWRGVLWARWGDALIEAGLQPNAAPAKLDEQFVLEKIAAMCRQLGKIPTAMELRLYKKKHPDYLGYDTVHRVFHSMSNMRRQLAEWARQRDDYKDIAAMLAHVSSGAPAANDAVKEGLVYLIRSGAHYKIGRSDELERRVKEIRIALPEAATLVHSIRTDDPAGIEACWHRRFDDRRANGEWFKLTNADVIAFKRRKYQ
jgi:hypothetical protein